MENLTIEERTNKIIELAGSDISAAINLTLTSEGVVFPSGNKALLAGNTIIPKL